MRTSIAAGAGLIFTCTAAVALAQPLRHGGDRTIGVSAPLSYVDSGGVMRVERTGRGRVVVHPEHGSSFRAGVSARAIVRFQHAPKAHDFAALSVAPLRELAPRLGMWLVESARRGEDGVDVAARLAASVRAGVILGAMPDLAIAHRLYDVDVPPNDPHYDAQWFFPRVGMEDAWRLEDGDGHTTIVIVDDGCDLTHPDLVSQLDPGRDVYSGDDDPSFAPGLSGNEHGTACAGVAAAHTDNGLGVAGACPECRLRCVRLLGANGAEIPVSADVEAFAFAMRVDAEVVSNSWGFTESVPTPDPLRAAIEDVIDNGRGGLGGIVLFAAGNDNRVIDSREVQAVRGVLTIGATNNFDEATSFSNHGPTLDVVAPTGSFTTDIAGAEGGSSDDYTGSFGGTSSACPLVAGVAGLLVSAKPTATRVEIQDALLHTAHQSIFADPDEAGHDPLYGYGLVQPAAALRTLLGLPDPPVEVDAGTTAADAGTARPVAGDGGGCSVAVVAPSRRIAVWIQWVILAAALVVRRVHAVRRRSGASRRA